MKDSNIRNLEMNLGVSCKNYPTEKISSYQGCIESFVYNLMKNYFKIVPRLVQIMSSGVAFVNWINLKKLNSLS